MADICEPNLTNPHLTFLDRLQEYANCKIMEHNFAQAGKLFKKVDGGNLIQKQPGATWEINSESIKVRSEYRSEYSSSEFKKEFKVNLSVFLKELSGLNFENFPKELRYLNVGVIDRKGVEHSKQFVAFTSIEKGNEHYANHETKWVAVNYTSEAGKPETVYLRAEEHQGYKTQLRQSLRKDFSKTVFEVKDPSGLMPTTPEQLEKMVSELCLINEKLCTPDIKILHFLKEGSSQVIELNRSK